MGFHLWTDGLPPTLVLDEHAAGQARGHEDSALGGSKAQAGRGGREPPLD